MVGFVESATLELVDETTGTVKKVNAALRGLEATSKKVAAALRSADFGLPNLDKSVRKINSLERALAGIGKPVDVRVRVNTSDIVDKLAAVKRTANFAASADLRIDTTKAIADLNAFKNRADNEITARLRLNANELDAGRRRASAEAETFGNSVRSYASGWAVNFAEEAGRRIARAVGEAILAKDAANAGTTALTFTDAEASRVKQASQDIAATSRTTSDADIQQLMNENMGTVKGNIEQNIQITREQSKLIDALVAQRESVEKARNSVMYYDKALENTGKLYDKEGNIAVESERRRRLLAQADIVGGADVTGETIANAVRNLGSIQKTLSDRELVIVALRTEDLRTRAATNMTNIEAGLKSATASSKARLREAGLLDENNKIFREDLMKENFTAWIQLATERAIDRLNIENKSSTEQSNTLAGLFSNSKAGGVFTQMFASAAEISRQADRVFALEKSGRMFEATDQSLNVSLQNVTSSFDSLVQRLSAPIEGPLTGAINTVAGAIQGIADFVVDPKTGNVDPAKAAGVTTAAGIGAGLLAYGGKKALDFLNPLSAPAAKMDVAANKMLAAAGLMGGTTPGTAAATAAAATATRTGLLATVSRIAAPIAATVAGLEIARYVDQGGDLGGLTTSIDNFVDRMTGWNPAKDGLSIEQVAGGLQKLIPAVDGINLIADKLATAWDRKPDSMSYPGQYDSRARPSEVATSRGPADAIDRQNVRDIAASAAAAISYMRRDFIRSGEEQGFQARDLRSFDIQSAMGTVADLVQGASVSVSTQAAEIFNSMTAARTEVQNVLNNGSTAISQAGASAEASIAAGGQTAGASMAQQLISAGGTVAGMLANAINSAAANVRVNVSAAKPIDTGSTNLAGRFGRN